MGGIKEFDFNEQLGALCAKEVSACLSSEDLSERITETINRLAAALGFTIAVACRGQTDAQDQLLSGVEAYMLEIAHDQRELARDVVRMAGLEWCGDDDGN